MFILYILYLVSICIGRVNGVVYMFTIYIFILSDLPQRKFLLGGKKCSILFYILLWVLLTLEVFLGKPFSWFLTLLLSCPPFICLLKHEGPPEQLLTYLWCTFVHWFPGVCESRRCLALKDAKSNHKREHFIWSLLLWLKWVQANTKLTIGMGSSNTSSMAAYRSSDCFRNCAGEHICRENQQLNRHSCGI